MGNSEQTSVLYYSYRLHFNSYQCSYQYVTVDLVLQSSLRGLVVTYPVNVSFYAEMQFFFPTVMTGLPRSSEHEERETFPMSMCEGCFLKIFLFWLYNENKSSKHILPKSKVYHSKLQWEIKISGNSVYFLMFCQLQNRVQ